MDPELPPILDRVPPGNVWEPLDNVDRLVRELGSSLPPVTWLIRSDDSVRFATGDFASGYSYRRGLWDRLCDADHELGWHMHLLSYDASHGCYSFDPEPSWLDAAFNALAEHFNVCATRTGWDFCSDWLMRRLDELGVVVDLSALPGNVAWHTAGKHRIRMDWLRSGSVPYHPAAEDYQQSGELGIIEVPITGFRNTFGEMVRRLLWRLSHGCLNARGLRSRSRMLTEQWTVVPSCDSPVAAFYFHPSGLTGPGFGNFLTNVGCLRALPGAEFVTASAVASAIQ